MFLTFFFFPFFFFFCLRVGRLGFRYIFFFVFSRRNNKKRKKNTREKKALIERLRTHFITRAQKQKQKQRQRRRAHEGKDSLDRGVFCFENSRGGCPFLARETERERERESVVPKSDEESKRGVAFVLVGVPRRHRENVVVKTRNRRVWFLVETLVPIFFISLMVVPSHLIEEKTVKSQFFISRPLANIAWGLTRGFESMDGGKYRIAYSPSGDEEVRKVAKKAALRLVCETNRLLSARLFP